MIGQEPQPDRPGSLRELLRVALPLIVSYTTSALMYVVDRIFLSWDSLESLAAALPAGVLHYNLAALGIGTVAYANAFVGQYEGALQHRRVGPILWQATYLSAAGSLMMLLFVPIAPWMFAWFGHHADVLPLEVSYFRIMCCGTFPLLLGTALSCFYSGRGQTTVIMVVNIIATLINVVLDYALIFGKLGFPRMGIDGAALATVIAFAVVPLSYIAWMLLRERSGRFHLWSGRRFDLALTHRLLRFGLPSGLQHFLDVACFTMFIQFVGRLGTEQLSATSLVFNLNSAVFMPMLGLATAVTALVGRRIGEGRPELAVPTTWLAAAVGLSYVFAFCFIYVLAPQAILSPYGLADKPELRELVVFLLKLVAVYSAFDALAVIFSSAVRGAGDTRFSMLFSFGLGLVLMVIPSYIASFYGEAGFFYSWYAATTFTVVLGIGFVLRFQQGRWKTMQVIEQLGADEDEELPAQDAELQVAR
jgi:MATE family multidrug resistance protein